jgi:Glycosyl transferases group 1
MQLFQIGGCMPSYRKRLAVLTRYASSFAEQRAIFFADRFGAVHFLKPVLEGDPSAFFTNGDDQRLQKAWALENGMSITATMDDILLAQIEHHRTEVLYNLDPVTFDNRLVRRLPGCVKRALTWRAAPSGAAAFNEYDVVMNNFPSLLAHYKDAGMRAEYFFPAHDPVMDTYAANKERPIDVLFVGGYSRYHARRAGILEAVAMLGKSHRIVYHLERSRLTRLSETPLGWVGPLQSHRRPPGICAVTADPVFGIDLYAAIGSAKIVLNGAIDMANEDRGNMRCWESMGCGAYLLSDSGNYPEGMIDGETMSCYQDVDDVGNFVNNILSDETGRGAIAGRGYGMIKERYSKDAQWSTFLKIAG